MGIHRAHTTIFHHKQATYEHAWVYKGTRTSINQVLKVRSLPTSLGVQEKNFRSSPWPRKLWKAPPFCSLRWSSSNKLSVVKFWCKMVQVWWGKWRRKLKEQAWFFSLELHAGNGARREGILIWNEASKGSFSVWSKVAQKSTLLRARTRAFCARLLSSLFH